MSLFKFGFTSHSDKDNEEEKQTKGRAETKQKYEKEKRKRRFLPKIERCIKMAWDSILNVINTYRYLFFLCYLVPTTYKFIVNILFKTS